MQAIKNIASGISDAFDYNSATLSGALDVIVVENEDGSMVCSPFHVRFGKFKLPKSKEKRVNIRINDKPQSLCMKLGRAGEAFFVQETFEEVSEDLLCSPDYSPQDSPEPMSPRSEREDAPCSSVADPIQDSPEEEKLEIREDITLNVPLESEGSGSDIVSPLDSPRTDETEIKQSRLQWLWGKLPTINIFRRRRANTEGEIQESQPIRKESMSEEEEQSEVQMSLCGRIVGETDADSYKIFRESRIDFETFDNDPWSLINDPRLVVKVEEKYYNWQEACPLLLSLLVFKRPITHPPEKQIVQTFRKTLLINSDQLRSLGLISGKNTVEYIVHSKIRGRQSIVSRIYLWKSTDKIVVSDIDGTITKSDVMGQLMPIVGKDWSHSGVVSLYNSIIANGYKVLYLSSRAIGQADATKNYLQNLEQEKLLLPEGPVLMSPQGLVRSFMREVVYKEPHIFKACVLKEIKHLFPKGRYPFYAGFGNKDTDAIAYRAVEIPLHKIFIIDPTGQLHCYNSTFQPKYPDLQAMADEMFPFITTPSADAQFVTPNFWRTNSFVPLVDLDDL